ncbi:MAG TPA: thiamine pyrophosphate-dependent enzyme [Burkholderiales bacterium]|nr:thiamine pyrophosphate-dependent enzyme [Burkholderiales bacterium]
MTALAAQSGAEALLRGLRAMGVERIFASPGSDWAAVWDALAAPHAAAEFPQYVSSRHEETAVAMALGYAKATGKLPAVFLHTTVGSLHATMIVRAALHERIPMVVFAGESIGFAEPPGPMVGRQWLRLLADTGGPARLMAPCVKWSFALNRSALLPQTAQRACQLAMAAPRGPVFVSVPAEYLMETMVAGAPAVAALPRPAEVAPAVIDEIAQALCAAQHPVIITEEAGKDRAAVNSLVALAESLGAPVLEAWQPYYVNFPRTHPLYGGILVDDMPAALAQADVVFLVESVAPWHPASAAPHDGARVIVLGEDPLHARLPFWGFRADLIAAGEVGPSLERLVDRVRQIVPPGSRRAMLAQWGERHERERATRRDAARAAGSGTALENRWIAHELNQALPDDAILVNETITHRLDLLRLHERAGAGCFYEASYGGLGVGLGLALGVKHAQPDRPVVCTIGDGAFHYNPVVGSFGAAQEHRLPILVVLFDNAGYLSQKTDVATYHPGGAAVKSGRFAGTSIVPQPDYVMLARAYGGTGEKVERPGDVRPALQRGLEAVGGGQLALVHLALEPMGSP